MMPRAVTGKHPGQCGSQSVTKTLSVQAIGRALGRKRSIRAQPAPLGRRFCGSHLIHTKRRTGAQCQRQNPPFFLRFGSKWPLPPNEGGRPRTRGCTLSPRSLLITGGVGTHSQVFPQRFRFRQFWPFGGNGHLDPNLRKKGGFWGWHWAPVRLFV